MGKAELSDGAPVGPGFTITVGFSGHRQVRGDRALAARLAAVFQGLHAAFDALAARSIAPGETLAQAFGAPWTARLLSGDAPGADRSAIAAWRGAGFALTHAVYPYRDPATGDPVTDEPARAGEAERATQWRELSAWTGFDPGGLGLRGDQAHTEVGHWMVAHSDVMVVYWDGLASRGPGGTADVVRRALERGSPVIWLKPKAAGALFFEPPRTPRRIEITHILAAPDDHAAAFAPDAFVESLAHLMEPPRGDDDGDDADDEKGDPEVNARRDYAAHDQLPQAGVAPSLYQAAMDRLVWSAFDRFKRVFGAARRLPRAPREDAPLPASLAAEPGFRRLQAAFETADRRANRLAAIHRSEQLLLIGIATLAVVVSVLPNLAGPDQVHAAHVGAALAEFFLGLFALLIRTHAHRARRHRRWGDARRLAERLRAAMLTWPLGVDLRSQRWEAPHNWTEWRALAELRTAGPPTGWIDGAELSARARWGAHEIIGGQAAYHERERRLAARIERRLKRIEGVSFSILMVALGLFLLGAWLLPPLGYLLRPSVSAVVLVLSAASPAIAAATLTLETALGLADAERRSTQCAAVFGRLLVEVADLERERRVTLHAIQHITLEAAEMLVEDADAWREQLKSRRLRHVG